MRRVSARKSTPDDASCDIHTPRSSIDTCGKTPDNLPQLPQPLQIPTSPSITPSVRNLFSLIPARHRLSLLIPALLASVVSGGIAPFMTYVIGQVFNAFSAFPISPNPSQAAKDALLHNVGFAALQLIGLAIGSLALGCVTSSLWIWLGEINVQALRRYVYSSVTRKDMVWFDARLGAADEPPRYPEGGTVGAGGLMSKFSRETDDVRTATSLASGYLIQYLTTCVACLILAFTRSWALTLVILSAVPVLILIQGCSQALAGPLLARERAQTSIAATMVDRALAAIATVKAFTAEPYEEARAAGIFRSLQAIGSSLNIVWGVTSAVGQFAMMAMFVQGFWFGAKLVRDGKVGAGDVMAVFWACLIATSNLQMCIPQFILFAKGKYAMASLLTLASSGGDMSKGARSRHLRGITPARCTGEMTLNKVNFVYPARPDIQVLSDVSLFLPAHEVTFIVGSSGSGKSTVAQLLLGLYEPQSGSVCLDDQDLRFLDGAFRSAHIAQVGGGNVILEGKSILDNILAGVEAGMESIEGACRVALMHEFVRDLPAGLATVLGGGQGVGLSGGQKQRLAIARARVRDPTVLILDEATSALDGTSRILVFEAIKSWRANKTTIVITHDLSQITQNDFVYVLKNGRVIEQGYRRDLEEPGPFNEGEFRNMMDAQLATGGFIPVELLPDTQVPEELRIGETVRDQEPASVSSSNIRPVTFGTWMLDVVADLTFVGSTLAAPLPSPEPTSPTNFPQPNSFQNFEGDERKSTTPMRRPCLSSIQIPSPSVDLAEPDPAVTQSPRRLSLQFVPASPTTIRSTTYLISAEERLFEEEKRAMDETGRSARMERLRWGDARLQNTLEKALITASPAMDEHPAFWKLMQRVFPSVPYKPLLLLGFLFSLASGAMTPLFSFLLSRLLFEVSIGAHDFGVINHYGGIVLAVAALDGILLGLKYFVMESVGMIWVTRMRERALRCVLGQDKAWFDRPANAPVRIVQKIVKDGDDARNVIGVVWAQAAVVTAMLGAGLVWALARGWQLTLVGLAIAPVFAGVMSLQTRLVANSEMRNKRDREEVARGFYETILNVRAIRAMALERVFNAEFDKATDRALLTGVRGAIVEGCSYGVATGLIYLAEALLFYVGAVLVTRGLYTYLQMVQVLNLVVFTVTIGSQLMAFTQKIAKSVQAASDLDGLLSLSLDTVESKGTACPPVMGSIIFRDVNFSYPERPDVPVLRNFNLEIADGECVAIVGASGSGKSTVAALLQRLYEPTNGTITIGPTPLPSFDSRYLRRNVAVVSQQAHMFDASVAENIRYGDQGVTETDIEIAARMANIDYFVKTLPAGYETSLGENGALVSGGQAQRIQVARALARPTRVFVLDECTSALDAENQTAVLEALRTAAAGRTALMITHKVQVMQMCDRVVVLQGGQVVEQGTFDELVRLRGVFATMANGGEWIAD